MKLKEADITYKARGNEFQFIKIICVDEKELCSMKVQEVVFGDFKTAEFPKKEFQSLIAKLDGGSIPFPEYSDGKSDSHVLAIQSGENAINLKWFGDTVNEQWKDILGFVDSLKKLKDKYIE
jgi:hypothetical protein